MKVDKITLVEAIINDSYLKELYAFKEKVICHTKPNVVVNKKQYKYIIDIDLIEKIDNQITNRINQIKKAYEY